MISETNIYGTGVLSNNIDTEYVQTRDCVFGVTASALNALSDIPINITGVDLQNILAEINGSKGEIQLLLSEVEKRFGEHKVWFGYIPNAIRDEVGAFDCFSYLVDSNYLVMASVDAPTWYKLIGYKKPVDEVGHSLLITGYRIGSNPAYPGIVSRSLIIRDPNLRNPILVPSALLYSSLNEDIKSHVLAFYKIGLY